MTSMIPGLVLSSAFWFGGSLLMGYAESKKRDDPYWSGTAGISLIIGGGAGVASVAGGSLLGEMGILIAFPLWIGLLFGGVIMGGFWFAPLLARRVSNPSVLMAHNGERHS